MKMNSLKYEQVKGLNIDKYKRMRVKISVFSLQAESWSMDCRRSGDCRMKDDSEFFQEYP